MPTKDDKEIKELLETQISYQRRIAKDLHTIYVLVILSLLISIIAGIVYFCNGANF